MTRKVGYGSPPTHSQFQKGQSGNPSGRPKRKASFIDDLAAELDEVITINEGGKPKRITKQRALIKAMTAGGIKGNARATSLIWTLAARMIEAGPANTTAVSASDRKIVEDFIEREVKARLVKQTGGE